VGGGEPSAGTGSIHVKASHTRSGERCQSASDAADVASGPSGPARREPVERASAFLADAALNSTALNSTVLTALGQPAPHTFAANEWRKRRRFRASGVQRIGGAVGRARVEHDTRPFDVNPGVDEKVRLRERGSKGSWRDGAADHLMADGCRPRATMQVRVRADLLSGPQIMRLRAMRATKNYCRWQRRPSVEPGRHPRAKISCHRPPGHCNI
jgi:hypothetical protein